MRGLRGLGRVALDAVRLYPVFRHARATLLVAKAPPRCLRRGFLGCAHGPSLHVREFHLAVQPAGITLSTNSFYMFYLALTLFLVFMLSWLIVCVKAMRRENRDIALAAERAHYARRKDRLA